MERSRNQKKLNPVLCGAGLALLVSMIFFSSLFRVKAILVNTNEFTSKDELAQAAGLSYGSNSIALISEGRLEKKLMKHPYVKSVKVTKLWPDKLKFDITYRVDSFAIANAGFYIILDDELKVLRVDKMTYDAFILEGITFKEFTIGEPIKADQYVMLEHIVDLKKLMLASHIGFEKKIIFDGHDIKVATKNGIGGNFGNGDNIEQRFNHFAEIFDNIQSKGISSGLIDVSNDGLPTYKPFEK